MNLRRHLLLVLLGVIAPAPTGSEGEEVPIPPPSDSGGLCADFRHPDRLMEDADGLSYTVSD